LTLNSFSLARRAADSEEAAFEKSFGWYDRFRPERTIDHGDAADPPTAVR
jgi:hypothetical protein